jgi:hypothetical protein
LAQKLAIQRREQLQKQQEIMRALSELSENETRRQRAFEAWKSNKDRIEREVSLLTRLTDGLTDLFVTV